MSPCVHVYMPTSAPSPKVETPTWPRQDQAVCPSRVRRLPPRTPWPQQKHQAPQSLGEDADLSAPPARIPRPPFIQHSSANLISLCDCHVISSFCKMLHLSYFLLVFSCSRERAGEGGVEDGFQAWDHVAGQLWPHPPVCRYTHKAPSTRTPDPGSPEQVVVSGQGLRVSGGRDGPGLTESGPGGTCMHLHIPSWAQTSELLSGTAPGGHVSSRQAGGAQVGRWMPPGVQQTLS